LYRRCTLRLVRPAGFPVLVLLAVPLAGCGTTAKRLTHSELEAKARVICTDYAERSKKEIVLKGADPSSKSALALARFSRGIGHAATLLGEEVDELRALRPPAQDAGRYANVLALYGQIENAYARAARVARRGDRRGLKAIGAEVEALYRRVLASPLGRVGLACE
jgi:hypothetical protein